MVHDRSRVAACRFIVRCAWQWRASENILRKVILRELLLLSCALAAAFMPGSAQAWQAVSRTWTSANGMFTVSAKLIEVRGEHVVLERDAGGQIRVPLDQLSEADRAYVRLQSAPPDVTNTASPRVGVPAVATPGGLREGGRPLPLGRLPGVAPSPFQRVSTLTGHAAPIVAMAFSLDGSHLVSCSLDGDARAWDTQTGRQWSRYEKQATGPLVATGVSPDNKLALLGDSTGLVTVWDVASGRTIRTHQELTAPIREVAISDDSRWLMAVDASNGYFRVPAQGGPGTINATRPINRINQAGLSPTGEFAFFPNSKNAIARVLNLPPTQPNSTRVLVGPRDLHRTVASERFVALVSSRGQYRLFRTEDLRRPAEEGEVYRYVGARTDLIWSRQAALTRDNRHLILMDPYEGCVEFTPTDFPGHSTRVQTPPLPAAVRTAAISPNGRMYAFGLSDGSISVFKLEAIPHSNEATVRLRAETLLTERRFAELDQLIDDMLRKPRQADGQDGQLMLRGLIIDLASGLWHVSDDPDRHQLLADWSRQQPRSAFAQLALSMQLLRLGWPDSVADPNEIDNDWEEAKRGLHRQYLEQARDRLMPLVRLDDGPLLAWDLLVLVGLGLDWKPEQLAPHFERLRRRAPNDYSAHAIVALSRSARFGNPAGDAADYAREVADRIGGDEGDLAYASIGMMLQHGVQTSKVFPQCRMDWNRLKRGLKLLAERYPQDRDVLRAGLRLAWDQEDDEAGRYFYGKLHARFPHWQRVPDNWDLDSGYVLDWIRLLADPPALAPVSDLPPLKFAEAIAAPAAVAVPAQPASRESAPPLSARFVLKELQRDWNLQPLQRYVVAYSPDGKHLAAGDADGNIQIWDAAGQRLVDIYPGHGSPITNLAYSGDGQTLFSISEDRVLRGWQQGEGRLLDAFDESLSVLPALRGRRVAVRGSSKMVWDAANLQPTNSFKTSGSSLCAISPDGRLLALSEPGKISLYAEPGVSVPVNPLPVERDQVAGRMAWSPDGSLFVYYANRHVHVIDWKTARVVQSMPMSLQSYGAMLFLSDNRTLLIGANDGLIVADALAGVELDTWPVKNVAAISPDRSLLIESGHLRPVFYSIERVTVAGVANAPVRPMPVVEPPAKVSVVPEVVATGKPLPAIVDWPVLPVAEAQAEPAARWEKLGSVPHESASDISLAAVGLVAYLQPDRQSILVRDTGTGKVVQEIRAAQVRQLELSPNGSLLAVSYPRGLALYAVNSGALLAQHRWEGEESRQLLFLPDCEHVLAVLPERILQLSVPDLNVTREYAAQGTWQFHQAYCSPGGNWLAASFRDENLPQGYRLYDATTGEIRLTGNVDELYGFVEETSMLVFSGNRMSQFDFKAGTNLSLRGRLQKDHYETDRPDNLALDASVSYLVDSDDNKSVSLWSFETGQKSIIPSNANERRVVVLPRGAAAIVIENKVAHFYIPVAAEPNNPPVADPSRVAGSQSQPPIPESAPPNPDQVPPPANRTPRPRPSLPPVEPWPILPEAVPGSEKVSAGWVKYGTLSGQMLSPIAVSPSGLAAYVGRERQSILVHDYRTGEIVREITDVHSSGSLSLSDDGTLLAYVHGRSLDLYRIGSGEMIGQLKLENSFFRSASFLPDSKHLVAQTRAGVQLLSLPNLTTVREFASGEASYQALSPSGKWLALSQIPPGKPMEVSIIDTTSGEVRARFPGSLLPGFYAESKLLYLTPSPMIHDVAAQESQRLWTSAKDQIPLGTSSTVDATLGLVATNTPESSITILHVDSRKSASFAVDSPRPRPTWLPRAEGLIVQLGTKVEFYAPPGSVPVPLPDPPLVAQADINPQPADGPPARVPPTRPAPNPNPTPKPLPRPAPGTNPPRPPMPVQRPAPLEITPPSATVEVSTEPNSFASPEDGWPGLPVLAAGGSEKPAAWRKYGEIPCSPAANLAFSEANVMARVPLSRRVVQVYNTRTGDLLSEVRNFSKGQLAISADGKLLVCASQDRFSLHDTKSGDLIRETPAPFDRTYTLRKIEFLPDGKNILLFYSQMVALMDLSEMQITRKYNPAEITHNSKFGVSPSGKYVAVGGTNATPSILVVILETATGKEIARIKNSRLTGFLTETQVVIEQPDAAIYDIETERTAPLLMRGGRIPLNNSAIVDPRRRLLACFGYDNRISVWDLNDNTRTDFTTGETAFRGAFLPATACLVALTSNRAHLIAPQGTSPPPPTRTQVAQPEPTWRPSRPGAIPPRTGPLSELPPLDDWPALPAASAKAGLPPAAWVVYGTFRLRTPSNIAVSPAELLAYVDAERRSLVVRNYRTGKVVREIDIPKNGGQVQLSPDGATVAWAVEQTIAIYRVRDGAQVATTELGEESIARIFLLPGDKGLIVETKEKLQLLSVPKLEFVREFASGEIKGRAVSPSGKWLAVYQWKQNRPSQIRIYETATGQHHNTLPGADIVDFLSDDLLACKVPTVAIYDIHTGEGARLWANPHVAVQVVGKSSVDAKSGLLVGSNPTHLAIWHLPTGAHQMLGGGHETNQPVVLPKGAGIIVINGWHVTLLAPSNEPAPAGAKP